ncbi:protein FAM200C-like [Oratosquilla oratoria]|uniref:protein FAM200C-like n=1 Tax=Oratosquilla oratoria TaxID=337810 RepID=UPI003F75B455
MSQDIFQQVITDLKSSPVKVSIQLDESTDVCFCSHLLAFVRYVKEKEVEEFLFCKPLKITAKTIDVLSLVKEFFLEHGMTLALCGSTCSDGAPNMLGNKAGFATLVKKEVPRVTVTHCVASSCTCYKDTARKLKDCLISCCACCKFHQKTDSESPFFASFWEEIGAEHSVLLYHTEVRRFSRGRVLRCI